jgi:hypothetical protein
MRALGCEISYEYLVGVSGLAFRMQLSKGGFCPSSPHPWCGYNCVARSNEALPWKMHIFHKPEGPVPSRGIRQSVVESIDAGVPAQYGAEEDGIVAGYQKGGDEWLCCHPQHDDGATMCVEANLAWGVAIPTERKNQAPNRRVLAEGALRQAVQMAEEDSAGGYFLGLRAWKEYIARLHELSLCDENQEMLFGSNWIYACLAEHRACASSYLREIGSEFSPPARDHLIQAALLYRRMSEVLTASGPGTDLSAPGANRFHAEQIQRLTDALVLEQKALGAIQRVVSSLSQ